MSPSPIQIALITLCGSLLAGFSCFQVAGGGTSALVALGFAGGLAVLTYAAVALVLPKRQKTLSEGAGGSVETIPEQPLPSAKQGLALAVCGFLLFFFSCGGAVLPVRGSPLTALGVLGMFGGAAFTLWGVLRLVKALWRIVTGPSEGKNRPQ